MKLYGQLRNDKLSRAIIGTGKEIYQRMRNTFALSVLLSALVTLVGFGETARDFRPPAVPLLTTDPFFSVWSAADRLTDVDTTHWCGAAQPIGLELTVDGKAFRLLGASRTVSAPALPQTELTVLPLTTRVGYAGEGFAVRLQFVACALPERLEALSRPVTYATLDFTATDGKPHAVTARLVVSGELATNDDRAEMRAEAKRLPFGEAIVLGRTVQKPLSERGDMVRCNWGRFWAVAPQGAAAKIPGAVQPACELRPELSWSVNGTSEILFAYDDILSLRFLGDDLKAWWRRDGKSFETMLCEAAAEREELTRRLIPSRDASLMDDFTRVGGAKYAKLAALAWRQSFAACKLVADSTGKPLYFSKENGSNGCMGTVDLLYPQLPHLLLTGPTLVEATLAPVMIYADSDRWPWAHAPHDVGTYPLGEGQVYNMWGEESGRMPVEESGNMLIAMAALARQRGNADFAGRWWPLLTKWAEYLRRVGYDSGDQLTTDDFAGHLSHNSNLSIKSILGIRSYALLAEMLGHEDVAKDWKKAAEEMVPAWLKAAEGGRCGSYKLTFDQPDSWSMKYNLVWDRLLGFNLFPSEVAARELAAYRQLLQPYGLPLDSRKNWTKVDWLVWCATLTGKRDDFEALIDGLYRFADETQQRLPFSDWYYADTSRWCGFIARSVIGGIMIPLLFDEEARTKYAARDTLAPFAGPYARPSRYEVEPLAPSAVFGRAQTWKWIGDTMDAGWYNPDYDDSAWADGRAPFANRDFRELKTGIETHTDWGKAARLYARRTFTLDEAPAADGEWRLGLDLLHDEEALVYLNGRRIAFVGGYNKTYDAIRLPVTLDVLQKGENTLAVMVHNTEWGACFDLGLIRWRKVKGE